METTAVVLREPGELALDRVGLNDPAAADIVVRTEWSGISTGTERLLYSGKMPSFPGMGYPLVPGYESVGRVIEAGVDSGRTVGERVYVPGTNAYRDVRGLFGGAAARLVVAGDKTVPLGDGLAEDGTLLALAATAYHAIAGGGDRLPDLIVGHGVLGRLLARIACAEGGSPTVWEVNPDRRDGAEGYRVIDPTEDEVRGYSAIYDVSGADGLLDSLIGKLAPGGEIVLAGFYSQPLSFAFPPAFLREARLRVAAEWKRPDLLAAKGLIDGGKLSLANLITHRAPAASAEAAYRTAFEDPSCLKMILDWSERS
ncbi:chlorophyll synthesis pathway protein BchC [Algihabitans albus]|uniref:chlorophyll synthesis pathway protein BchC n=1 Tax=Algihabitans albus TaxID=2164067 RepID=UPI000E5D93E7|nr:chlorophyll synthesis pathway protein BchC [Algihabitans albus]